MCQRDTFLAGKRLVPRLRQVVVVATRPPPWHTAAHGYLQTMRGIDPALEDGVHCLPGDAPLRNGEDDGKTN